MPQNKLAVVVILMMFALFPYQVFAACTGASPTWNCTPDYASLDNLLNYNSPAGFVAGDTVNVSAGSATWSARLTITKGVRLIGAGIGSTVITSSYNDTSIDAGLVKYEPTDYAADIAFRLSGFTIDGAGKSGCVTVTNNYTTPITKVRLDNNRFYRPYHLLVNIRGMVYGVADHNQIDMTSSGKGSDALDHYGIAPYGQSNWQNLSFNATDLGTNHNFYWETNTFTADGSFTGDNWDCSHGGRYAARFNTITTSDPNTQFSPVFNYHGNQNVGEYSCMGTEIYNNTITAVANGNRLLSQRGGKSVTFGNSATGGSWDIVVREDANGCDLAETVKRGPAPYYNPMYPNESYHFANTISGSLYYSYSTDMQLPYRLSGGVVDFTQTTCTTGASYRNIPQENVDVWFHKPSFNGTVGVGVGTLTSRPATCTTGVGYWATDQGSWNQSGSGGQGVLYKCTATDTWSLYYTPYTYPHPLAGGADTTPAAFSFTDNTGVALSTVIYSTSVQVTAIDNTTTLALTGTGCEYRKNAGSWVAGNDNVSLNDNVALRTTSSGSYNTPVSCTLNLGGVTDTWYATTVAAADVATTPRFRGSSMSGAWR